MVQLHSNWGHFAQQARSPVLVPWVILKFCWSLPIRICCFGDVKIIFPPKVSFLLVSWHSVCTMVRKDHFWADDPGNFRTWFSFRFHMLGSYGIIIVSFWFRLRSIDSFQKTNQLSPLQFPTSHCCFFIMFSNWTINWVVYLSLYCKAIMIWNNVHIYIYILHYIVTFTYIFYIWCNMIYVFDCFPWILRFNIGPARENRDRVYVTDAKCPHQGGFRNRRNNHFDHLQKMDFLIKGEENIGKFTLYIYIYIQENDEKRWENDGLPCLSDIT